MIHKPIWNHSVLNLSDLQIILKWFWGKSQQILVIREPFWNDSGANLSDSQIILKWCCAGVNLGDLLTILKWLGQIWVIREPFWNDSGVNLSDSWTILKWSWSESWWLMNHSEMILEQISLNPSDSQTILKWFVNQESSCILTNHTWFKRGRANLPEYIYEDSWGISSDSHWITWIESQGFALNHRQH